MYAPNPAPQTRIVVRTIRAGGRRDCPVRSESFYLREELVARCYYRSCLYDPNIVAVGLTWWGNGPSRHEAQQVRRFLVTGERRKPEPFRCTILGEWESILDETPLRAAAEAARVHQVGEADRESRRDGWRQYLADYRGAVKVMAAALARAAAIVPHVPDRPRQTALRAQFRKERSFLDAWRHFGRDGTVLAFTRPWLLVKVRTAQERAERLAEQAEALAGRQLPGVAAPATAAAIGAGG